ncbi:MAG: EpsG family protein [Paludibacteraceae bacterium]|nr:EpsG family protein [Paludibacteraceae bacterium]
MGNLIFPDKLYRQIVLPLTTVMLIAIAGLRYETGGDWYNYTTLFRNFPNITDIIAHPRLMFAFAGLEEGFVVLASTIRWLGGSVQTLFLVIAIINLTLIGTALYKYTKYPVFGLLCYYCILYFNLEMIYIRQATAVALCFYALQYIQPKRVGKYMLMVVLACLFHRVAVVMIPLYFFLDKRLPQWLYLTIIGLGALVMLAGFPWITKIFITVSGWLGQEYANRAEMYTEMDIFAAHRTLSIGFVLNLLIFGCVVWFKDKIDAMKHGTVHLNMFFLSLVLYYYCYELVEVSNRFRLFFLISIIVIMPLIVENFFHWFNKAIAFAIMTAYCFSFSMHIFLEYPKAAAYNPYQNYIDFKLHPRPSSGPDRLKKSIEYFHKDRGE